MRPETLLEYLLCIWICLTCALLLSCVFQDKKAGRYPVWWWKHAAWMGLGIFICILGPLVLGHSLRHLYRIAPFVVWAFGLCSLLIQGCYFLTQKVVLSWEEIFWPTHAVGVVIRIACLVTLSILFWGSLR